MAKVVLSTRDIRSRVRTARVLAIEYDPLGRVTRRTNPDGTFSTRIYAPGTVTLTDENGHQTVQTWQAFGHPDDARMASLVDADQKLWSYSYHLLGELWTVSLPMAAHARGRITSSTCSAARHIQKAEQPRIAMTG
jgi:YD repeat-containing protein